MRLCGACNNMEMFGACPLFLTLEKKTHQPFKCKESSCLAVGSGLAVRLVKMEAITERGCSMNYRFSDLVVPVFSPFTLKEVTYKTYIAFLSMKKYNHS